MIKNINMGGMTGPVLYCDTCGKRIEDASRGIALAAVKVEEKRTSEVLYLHKGKCHAKAEAKVGSNGWQELSRHLVQLIYNVGLSIEDLEARKDTDCELGGAFFTKAR
jgi:hypothetical protein